MCWSGPPLRRGASPRVLSTLHLSNFTPLLLSTCRIPANYSRGQMDTTLWSDPTTTTLPMIDPGDTHQQFLLLRKIDLGDTSILHCFEDYILILSVWLTSLPKWLLYLSFGCGELSPLLHRLLECQFWWVVVGRLLISTSVVSFMLSVRGACLHPPLLHQLSYCVLYALVSTASQY